MATDRAPDIYVPLLMTKGHGYPLWLPDPFSTLPPAYLRCGTQVGDLGYLTDDGGFAYLFNVCKDASDPINLNRVPPDFVPVTGVPDPGIQGRLEIHDKNSVITTAAVEQRSIGFAVSAEAPFEFTSSSSRAAILVLPGGGERYDSEHPLLLQEHTISNAHSWYKHFNGPGQGRQIRNGMLYLVTGCDKCHSLGNACYLHPTKSSSASLKFVATGVATLAGTACYRWEVQAGVHKRSHHHDMTPGATANQTIFLRGYSISVREDSSLRVKLRITNPVKTSNKNKPQRVGSLVPYSAKQLSTSRPGTAWQGHDMMHTTGRSLLDSEADGFSSDEVPESSEDESETGKLIMDIPYGHATMQAETLIRQLPGRGKIVNPSALVNKYILDTYRDATIALTHDDFEWTGMTQNPLDVVELASYALDNLVSIKESLTTPNAWVAKRRDADIGAIARQNDINSASNSWNYSRHWNPTSPSTRSYTPQWSVLAEVDDHMVRNESQPPIWTRNAQRRRMVAVRQRGSDWSAESVDLSGTGSSSSLSDTPNGAR